MSDNVVRVSPIPERLPNDPRMEWLFAVLEPHPPASRKRLIIQARHVHVGIIDDMQADILIDALGLRHE